MTSPRAILLTAPGRSALAVIAVRGEGATTAVSQHFVPAAGGTLAERAVGRVLFGQWQGGTGGEGVVVRRVDGEQWEVHPHGGTAACRAILDDLIAAGCRETSWQQELTAQAADPLTAAATVALTQATTERTAAHLLHQQRGALRSAFREIADLLDRKQQASALAGLHRLLASSRWGLHLTRPWKVLLCGAPNVGKSSLINALLGYGRSIVFDTPGTTRDLLSAHTAIAGWPVELTDTAGLRTSTDPLEAAGIARAEAALSAADLVLVVLDQSRPVTADDRRLLPLAKGNLVIANKADLPSQAQLDEFATAASSLLATSATTGQGVPELLEAIARHLVGEQPAYSQPVLFTPEQVAMVQTATERCQQGDFKAARAVLLAP